MDVTTQFISVGCNRLAHCAAWTLSKSDTTRGDGDTGPPASSHSPSPSPSPAPAAADPIPTTAAPCLDKANQRGIHGPMGTIAFCAGSMVAVYDPISYQIKATLRGHSSRATTVAWISHIDTDSQSCVPEEELVSGGTDGRVIVWKVDRLSGRWAADAILEHPDKAAITNVAPRKLADGSCLIVASGTDGSLVLWTRPRDSSAVDGDGAESKAESESSTGGGGEGGGDDSGEVGGDGAKKLSAGCWNVAHCSAMGSVRTIEALSVTELPGYVGKTVGSPPPGHCSGIMVAAGGVDCKVHLLVVNGGDGGLCTLEEVLALPGHEDWVRDCAFAHAPLKSASNMNSIALASASQDHKVRLWTIETGNTDEASQKKGPEVADAVQLDVSGDGVDAIDTILALNTLVRSHSFRIIGLDGKEAPFSVHLEALLTGHEDWVNSVRWSPPQWEADRLIQPPKVLTASMDKSMMLWSPEDDDDGVWVPGVSMGGVGGDPLGFFGGIISPDGLWILAHGYQGAFHLWYTPSEESGTWSPFPAPSGHFGGVMDIAFGMHGGYVMSVSHDQTARVFALTEVDLTLPTASAAPRGGDGASETKTEQAPTVVRRWAEVGRPQVHGYDLNSVVLPPSRSRPHCLVSGADEKILRIFDAPVRFFRRLDAAKVPGHPTEGGWVDTGGDVDRAYAAFVPELGLSNKSGSELKEDETIGAVPFEEELVQDTMWPEVNKLYGHGNEIVCLATSSDGTLVASTCRARTEHDAAIRLWDTDTWAEHQVLAGHKLTVVTLAFSPSDRFLVSGSKDRTFCLFQRQMTTEPGTTPVYNRVASVKAHRRIIWTCAWSGVGSVFATGARDQLVKVWGVTGSVDDESTSKSETGAALQLAQCGELPVMSSAVTAVTFQPFPKALLGLVVGLECGSISFWSCTSKPSPGTKGIWEQTHALDPYFQHAATVRKLLFNPSEEHGDSDSGQQATLVSCSTDNSVRVFRVSVV